MPAQRSGMDYAVDIIMCIDTTLSMTFLLDEVKKGALAFHSRLTSTMSSEGRAVSQLRIKVIAFRDFGDHASDALVESDFFVLPEQEDDYVAFVSGLDADGGGDDAESGLEALATALASSWERGADRRRHVTVLFTDASAHPLGSPRQVCVPGYPQSLPRSMDALFTQWGHAQSRDALMENSAKRLLLFAPEVSPWIEIAEYWNNTLFFPSVAGDGLEEWELDEIIGVIANSV